MNVELQLSGCSLVLCDDKPNSFGAPDVIQLGLDQLVLRYTGDLRYHDVAPEMTGSLQALLSAHFLNNSSTRWGPLGGGAPAGEA